MFMGGISIGLTATPRRNRNNRIHLTFGVLIADLAPGEPVILRYSVDDRQINEFCAYYDANIVRLEETIDVAEALAVAANINE